jgi:hypothetical protein
VPSLLWEQGALDLWGGGRSRPPNPHQRGFVRLPYDTAGLGKTGDLAQAWVCCRCDRPELSRYLLELNHSCCDENRPQGCARPLFCDLTPYWIASEVAMSSPTSDEPKVAEPCGETCSHPRPCEGGQWCRCPTSTPCWPRRGADER